MRCARSPWRPCRCSRSSATSRSGTCTSSRWSWASPRCSSTCRTRASSRRWSAPTRSPRRTASSSPRSSSPASPDRRPAGWLIGVLAAPLAILIDALTYVASFIALLFTKDHEKLRAPEDHAPLLKEIGEGLRWVFGNPLLRRIVGTTGVANFFNTIMMTLLPIFAAARTRTDACDVRHRLLVLRGRRPARRDRDAAHRGAHRRGARDSDQLDRLLPRALLPARDLAGAGPGVPAPGRATSSWAASRSCSTTSPR